METLPARSSAEIAENHRYGIGSSEITTIAGLNPYKSRLQLWMEKTGKIAPPEENTAMWLGTQLEPVVAKMFQRDWNGGLVKCEETYKNGWRIATPDYFLRDPVGRTGILECKTTSAYKKVDWQDSIPDFAHCQVIWQMGVTSIHWGFVACLIGGREFAKHPVEFDLSLYNQLVVLAEAFMRQCDSDSPPAATDSDLDHLKTILLDQELSGETIYLPSETTPIAEQYVRIKSELKQIRKQETELCETLNSCEAKIRQLMGNHANGISSSHKMTLKRWTRKAYQVNESRGTTLLVEEFKK